MRQTSVKLYSAQLKPEYEPKKHQRRVPRKISGLDRQLH